MNLAGTFGVSITDTKKTAIHQEDRHRGPHELLLPSCWSRWDIAFRSVCSRCGLAAFPIDSPPENPSSIGSGSGSARAGPAGSAVAPFLHAKGAIALGDRKSVV